MKGWWAAQGSGGTHRPLSGRWGGGGARLHPLWPRALTPHTLRLAQRMI
jgi:hypothetical protein